MTNSVDPDQMLHSVASDLVLHCLSGLSVPILRDITVCRKMLFFNENINTAFTRNLRTGIISKLCKPRSNAKVSLNSYGN